MTVYDMVANFSEIEFTHLIPDALTAEVAVDMVSGQPSRTFYNTGYGHHTVSFKMWNSFRST